MCYWSHASCWAFLILVETRGLKRISRKVNRTSLLRHAWTRRTARHCMQKPTISSTVCSSLSSHQLAKQYSFAMYPAVKTFNCIDYDLHTRERDRDLGVTRCGRSASRISWMIATALVTKRKSLIVERCRLLWERERYFYTAFILIHSSSRCIASERTTWPIRLREGE